MGYTSQADLVALFEAAKMAQAVHDAAAEAGETPEADAATFAAIQAAVDNEIHSYLESRYPVPLPAPVPALVKEAELVLEAEMLYARRGVSGQNNPWSEKADKIRDRLEKIRDGQALLSIASSANLDAGGIVSEPSMTFSPGRTPL